MDQEEKEINMFGTRKMGRVLIDQEAIRNAPGDVRNLLSMLLPIKIMYNPDTKVFDYWCIGEDVFDELEDNEAIPVYRTVIHSDKRVEFHRVSFDRIIKAEVKDEIMQLIIENSINMEDFKEYIRKFTPADDEDFKEYDENFLGALKLYLKVKENKKA